MSLTPTPATPGKSPRQKLPIGIQTFAHIREDGCYYVDKTGFALKLIEDQHTLLFEPPKSL